MQSRWHVLGRLPLRCSLDSVAYKPCETGFCHVWRYSGGKVVEGTLFGDTAPVYKALEQQETA